jgi:hypothetical protein
MVIQMLEFYDSVKNRKAIRSEERNRISEIGNSGKIKIISEMNLIIT